MSKPSRNSSSNKQIALRVPDRLSRLEAMQIASPETHSSWMLQLSPETRSVWERDFLTALKPATPPQKLSGDFYLLSLSVAVSAKTLLESVLPRWVCPLQHQWPVNPRSERFVERAAHGLEQKLGLGWTHLQILCTTPDLKAITVGLKGRLLQLQSDALQSKQTEPMLTQSNQSRARSQSRAPDTQQPSERAEKSGSILVVLVHKKGVCAGLSSGIIELGSALAGGLGFLKNSVPAAPPDSSTDDRRAHDLVTHKPKPSQHRTSRAGGKISEILMLLNELHIDARDYPTWLELGAAPGGMTEELIRWGSDVTAVDLAELAPQVRANPKVTHWKRNANEIVSAHKFSALLSDMNGPYQNAAHIVATLIATLTSGSLIVHTLKIAHLDELRSSIQKVCTLFEDNGAKILTVRHLFHNRKEVTVVAVRT